VTASPRESRRIVVADAVRGSMGAHERFLEYGLDVVVEAAEAMAAALRLGGRVLAFGNGGSAADAQHFAAELVGRFEGDRTALAGLALATDASVMTSVANDFGYGAVFARQIEALGRPGDVAVGISTSGASESVVRGLMTARDLGITTVALTGGDGGAAGRAAAVHVNVREPSVARVQEVHRTILHAICGIVEREIGRRP
jgi:D-sedoheptulose 7-phosphate isomerase